jgi:hypothetical protein
LNRTHRASQTAEKKKNHNIFQIYSYVSIHLIGYSEGEILKKICPAKTGDCLQASSLWLFI